MRGFLKKSPNQDLIYFLHIPKTAGMSLIRAVGQVVDQKYMLHVPFNLEQHYVPELDPKNNPRLKFVSGHFDFEFQKYLSRSPIVITMLRHPVDRLLSLYSHLQNPKNFPETPDLVLREDMTFEEFLSAPSLKVSTHNYQVKVLAGWSVCGRTFGNHRVRLQIAKMRLKEMVFFGLTEKFDDSIRLLFHRLNWNVISEFPHINRNTRAPNTSDLSESTKSLILEQNELDLELYHYAESLFSTDVNQLS